MERLIYWIKRIVNGNNKYCNCWCGSCPYYKRCRRDGFKSK